MLPAIDATLATLAAHSAHPREMEQAGRALGTLTRTLRELNALLAEQPARPQDDDMPEDMDEFRNELARRINAFCDAKEAEQREATGEPAAQVRR